MKRLLAHVVVSALAVSLLGAEASAAFPGENGRIVFFRGFQCDAGNCGSGGSVWTIGRLGHAPVKLRRGVDPRWSPDGKLIAFWRPSPSGSNQIFVMRNDGSGSRQLTFGSKAALDPAWSPDGSRIAFAQNTDLWVLDLGTNELTQLTNDRASVHHDPVFSPDGSTVAFMRCGLADWVFVRCSKPPDVALLDLSSGEVRELTLESDLVALDPDWSPDGSKLVMTCDDRDIRYVVSDTSNICIVDVDTGNSQTIFNRRAAATEPSWSPDGRRIAFVFDPRTEEDGDTEIHTMLVDGSRLLQVTDNGTDDYAPDWQAR